MRLLCSLVVALVAACSSPAAMPDGGRPADAGVPLDARAPDASSALEAGTDAGGDGGADAGPSITRIRVVYPPGHTITIRGSATPLRWDIGAEAVVHGGVYELSIPGLAGGAELKAVRDGTDWSRGPNYHVEPGQTIVIAPHFDALAGRVVAMPDFASTILGNTRPVWVYLPASYGENTATDFPVVYMHDGQNLFDPALAFGGNEWEVDETCDRAAAEGRCPDASPCQNDGDCGGMRCETFHEAIVVGVGNTAARMYEYTPSFDATVGDGGGADDYLRALIEELGPSVDAAYRTRHDPAQTGILGSSLGGLVSAYAGVVHPEVYGRIGAMSPSTWWDDRMILDVVGTVPSRPRRALRVYVDSGDSGPSNDDVADTAMLADAYRAIGYADGSTLDYLVGAGDQHNEIYWRRRVPDALQFLLGPREEIAP